MSSGHTARKRFGQHWLKDDWVLRQIIFASDLQEEDGVLEIGPGRGALTQHLLSSKAGVVHAIELDRDLIPALKKRFKTESRFSIQQGDILTEKLTPPDKVSLNKVVANIPYNITGPLLETLMGRLDRPTQNGYKRLVLLLQKEVADRILASPGQSLFSALSVRIQLSARCRDVCEVPPYCFQPPPKVNSKVIVIEPFLKKDCLDLDLAIRVETLLKHAFLSRRKMLHNSLKGLLPNSALEEIVRLVGINLNKRPQDLSPSQWVSIAKYLEDADLLQYKNYE